MQEMTVGLKNEFNRPDTVTMDVALDHITCGHHDESDEYSSGYRGYSSEHHKQRHSTPLEHVLKYRNNAVTARIAEEIVISAEDAEILFQDVLKFLWLAAKFGSVVPSPRIDEGWHTFLLFTKDYHEFCQEHFGIFLHHRPRRPEDKPDGGKLRSRTHDLIAKHLCGNNLGANWDHVKLGKDDCEQSCAPSRDCA